MATYEEVSNTLSELEKKVLNHYNVAKVREHFAISIVNQNFILSNCFPCFRLFCLSCQQMMTITSKLQAREIQRATEAYLLFDGSQWSSTPPVKVSTSISIF
jgi:hypothetical protein